nr:HAD family hydrolase [Chloroflexota bacterium]
MNDESFIVHHSSFIIRYMLRGAIFDLGSTLIHNEYDNQWALLRPRLIADLVADLRAQGLTFDPAAFAAAFNQNLADFDDQRQTHFKEITTEYTLRATFSQLGIAAEGLDLPHALSAYFAFSEQSWRPMPHVHQTLATLRARGLKLALVSNAADEANVQRLIDRHALRPYFDPIIVSAAAGVRKPNPRIFQPVIKSWGFHPSEIVMIGDTLGADVLGAKNAGFKSIWVTMQADTPGNLAHRETILPDAVVDSLEELPATIETMNDER